jgi:Peptidase family M23
MKKLVIDYTQYDDRLPIVVRSPLQGEWFALQTPGHKIPSHGTDQLGQRFAFDFVHADDMKLMGDFWAGLRYWFAGGIPLSKCKGINAPILAPLSGKVVAARDGWPERKKATPLDIAKGLTLGFSLSEDRLRADYRFVTGNYIIIKCDGCYAFFAHATTNSIRVSEGEDVQVGQHIADVGHTGNSTAPHLHFQLMDGPDLWTAKGLPCCFKRYELLLDDNWQMRENGIPGKKDHIRFERVCS